jgi:hypothetical protein
VIFADDLYEEGLHMVQNRTSAGILLAAVFLFTCVAASAPSDAQITGPCAETVTKYCKDVTPGGGRIMKCLNDHRDDQSMACRDWLEDQNRSLKELNTACTKEISQLCSFSNPSSSTIFWCLEANYISLRSDCRDKLREIKDRMQ